MKNWTWGNYNEPYGKMEDKLSKHMHHRHMQTENIPKMRDWSTMCSSMAMRLTEMLKKTQKKNKDALDALWQL